MQTVIVVREDHPDGAVRINACDMTEDDVIFTEKAPAAELKEGTKSWIAAELEVDGIEFDKSANKAELQKLLDDSKTDPE